MITPHPEAQAALNRRAEELLSRVRLFTPEELKRPQPTFEPDIAAAAIITDKDIIGSVTSEDTDPHTAEVKRILLGTTPIMAGIEGEACNLLDSLAAQAIKCCQISKAVSADFMRNYVKEWLRLRFEDKLDTDFTQALMAKVANTVTNLEVLIPIASLSIESDFALGRIAFRTITRQLLDEWHDLKRASGREEDRPALEEHLKRERQELQGLTAATQKLEAEPDHATAQTLELADNTVSYLNIFHPANITPRLICHTRTLGQEYVPRYVAFIQKSNGGMIIKRSLFLPPPERWVISDARLGNFRQLGLASLHDLLSLETQSDFQAKLLEVLLIYSRNSLAREPVEKLIYILVALESMLLKDPHEPIQQNIGERLAFAVGSNGAQRQEIVSLVRTCYDYRSKYLHHGFNISSLDAIGRLMNYAWTFFRLLIREHGAFESKRALIDALDARKFE